MPFFLTPEQKQSAFWLALWLALALLLYSLGPILSPFIASAILAYMLGGAVDRLSSARTGKHGLRKPLMPRVVAVSIVLTAFILGVLALVLIVVPVLRAEIPLLQAKSPAFFTKLDAMFSPWLAQYGIHVKLDSEGLRELLTRQVAASGDDVWATVLAKVRVGGSALLGFVPYLGFGLGMLLALVAALLQFAGWSAVIWVAVIYTVGQLLESFILTPRLVGERIGLHPLAVIFALMAFGELFGFAGVLLALPASAVLMVGFRHVRSHYLRSSFYNA